MSDTTEFDLDLTLNQPLSHEQPVELFAFDDCKTYPLPDRKLLIRNPNNGKSAVIMPEVLTALAQCAKFATMENHIEAVTRAMPQLRDHPDQVRQVLDSMLREGMMISARTLCDAFNAEEVEEDSTADDPAIVAIITCDRPDALERLLDSIAENADPAGFESLYVIDDSRAAESIERNRALVEAFNSDSQIETIHFGREQQSELMHGLIGQAPGHEASIRFLIDFEQWRDEKTYGLARNYALLLSRSKKLVMLDDDTLFRVYEPQPRPKGINLRDEICEAEFFDAVGDWPGMKARPELDPVKAHLYCLGLPLRQAMGRLGVSALLPEHLAGCTVAEVRRLKGDSPLLVTQCGSLGDPGVGNNTWIIELTGESRAKMLASEASVERAVKNDNAWSGRKQPHVGARSNMSQIVGLDNRRPLPPYFPIGRGEDRLFGIMLAALYPDVSVLDYPWAAPHLSTTDRSRDAANTSFTGMKPFPEFYVDWLDGRLGSWLRESLAGRFDSIAGVMIDLSELTSDELVELHRDYQSHMACKDLAELQSTSVSAKSNPKAWQAFITNGLKRVNEELKHQWMKGGSEDESAQGTVTEQEMQVWRARWRAFGDACRYWRG
jgi:hypothetical protein